MASDIIRIIQDGLNIVRNARLCLKREHFIPSMEELFEFFSNLNNL
jgi:hypothetical protein